MKKILSVNPTIPLIWKKGIIKIHNHLANPYILSIIASILKTKYHTSILDANIFRLTQDQTIKHIKKFNPDVLILSTASIDKWQKPIPEENYFFNILKEVSCQKIIFGPHVTMNPKRFTNYADKLIIGEPESHFPQIIESKGTILRKKFINNLDSLPFPAYDLLPMKKYKEICLVTSRGCPFKCIFCYKDMWGDEYRIRSDENIIKELKFLKSKYKIKQVSFWDLEFTLDRERVLKLCKEMIEENVGINWWANARASSVDFEMLELMKEAGCTSIGIGIESGSDKTLKTIKKGITAKQSKDAIKMARKAGIKFVHATFQIGFPNETYEDIKESYSFFKSIDNDNLFCVPAIPYPDTELNKIGKVGSSWEDVVNWPNRVNSDINMKLIFYYTNLKLFLNKITFGLPKLIRFFYRKIFKILSGMDYLAF